VSIPISGNISDRNAIRTLCISSAGLQSLPPESKVEHFDRRLVAVERFDRSIRRATWNLCASCDLVPEVGLGFFELAFGFFELRVGFFEHG
jgi:hypothetical protein